VQIQGWALRPRFGFGTTIGLAFALSWPVATAQAWTATSAGGVLQVAGSAGEVNALAVADGDPGTFVISNDVNALSGAAPAGCAAIDDGSGAPITSMACSLSAITIVVIAAGDGADTVDVATTLVPVTAEGGDDADQLTGANGDETFAGGAGDDLLDGGGGNDTIAGGAGADQLAGGEGDDTVSGDADSDQLDGGGGNDAMSGADGNDAVAGGSGDDQLRGDAGDDQLTGEEGTDTVQGGLGNDGLDGGLGNDTSSGGDGDDTLEGADGHDALSGDAGDDTLNAGPAGAALAGGDGNDLLQGSTGPDVADGGTGNDTLSGEEGPDALRGGDGEDVLDGGGGPDALRGGGGVDRVTYETAPGDVTVTIGNRPDDGTVGEGDDVAADVETVQGGLGDDRLTAGAEPATLLGSDGQDVLSGGPGADRIDGGAGEDTIDGGRGADVLTGGGDVDTVTYTSRKRAVTVNLQAGRPDGGETGEGDLVQPDVEAVVGGSGDDVLRGARGVANTLSGGPGEDDLVDRANGDAVADDLRCGTGTDRTHGDNADLFAADCENVWVDGARTRYGTSPSNRPSTYLTGQPLRGANGTIRVRLRCQKRTPNACRVAVTLTKRGVSLGHTNARLSPGLSRDVRVTLTPEGRAKLVRYRASTLLRVRVSVRGGGVPVVASLPIGARR